jgi:hypothetical protein
MFWIGILIGAFIGALAGVVAISLCVVSARADGYTYRRGDF